MWNQREGTFLTYNAATGFNNAAFTNTNSTGGVLTAATFATTDIARLTASSTIAANITVTPYALSLAANITLASLTEQHRAP